MTSQPTDHSPAIERGDLHGAFIRRQSAERLSQITSMVASAMLASTEGSFNKPVLRDLYRALLPESVPNLPGWEFEVFYRPAEILSADFYDFIPLPDGRLGISIGDVAGKGPSAAFRMARASNLLQEFAGELLHPGAVLQRVNDILCQDHQPAAFVTCFYIVLDPASGKIEFANAGHNLPYKRSSGQQNQVDELYATGMPLGIFPKRIYEQQTAWISPGEALLLLSDGVLEARDRQGRIFGEERVLSMLKEYSADRPFVAFAKDKILEFTESEWDRQDDITLIKMFRLKQIQLQIVAENINIDEAGYSRLAEFSLSSAVGNERLAMERLAEIVRPLGLDAPRLENLKTAVAETVMNAIHHGNRDQTEIPVSIDVRLRGQKLFVRVIDSGSDPFPEIPVPDLEAKLSGEQSARGWGLFLIQQMVDEMFVSIEDDHHTVELVMYLDGDIDDDNE